MRQSVKSAILVHVLKNGHKMNGGNAVKFIRQFLIIILISFAGELLHAILPLPVPASIYGLLILLAGLQTKVIPLKAVDEAGGFLIEIMPDSPLPRQGVPDSSPRASCGSRYRYIFYILQTSAAPAARRRTPSRRRCIWRSPRGFR